jgi:tetratricopeptide (TPR) repeat protein
MFTFRSLLKVRSSAIVCALFLTALSSAVAQEEGKRVALIIGNNNYSISPLRNAINDARLMDKALQAAGFKTILKEDANYPTMEEAVAKFAEQLGPDDTALFFYAGHGVQIESENFLVPVDFEAASTVIQAKFKCFRLASLFEELKKRTKRSIIILDACRSNPVAETHALQSGLAQPQVAGMETFIAYSTSPGQVAADNPAGRDSWFTEALADLIEQPGLTLDDVFTRVKSRVSTETEGHQSPWTISNLTKTFYFHPPSNLQTANDPTLAAKWMLEAQRREQREDWDQAIRLVNQVLQRKPGGVLETSAQAKLPYLVSRKDAEEKYAAGRYKEAAVIFEKTLNLDPFAIDSAFQAVNSYLLSDNLSDAVHLLGVIRLRGTSESVAKSNAMLKELGSVYPEAAQVIKTELPAPPPVQELFQDIQFGSPDWSAGIRSAQSSPVSLSRWAKALDSAYPPPAEPITQTADAKVDNEVLHVEVNPAGGTRDLSIRKIGDQTDQPTGTLLIIGSFGSGKVLVNGQWMADPLPAPVKLPPGKYSVRLVEKGMVVGGGQEVEVVAFQTKTIPLTRNK